MDLCTCLGLWEDDLARAAAAKGTGQAASQDGGQLRSPTGPGVAGQAQHRASRAWLVLVSAPPALSTSLGAHVGHRGCTRMSLCPAEELRLRAWHSLPPAATGQWYCVGLGNVSCRIEGAGVRTPWCQPCE